VQKTNLEIDGENMRTLENSQLNRNGGTGTWGSSDSLSIVLSRSCRERVWFEELVEQIDIQWDAAC
jgi:hypothetical protein